MIKNMIIALQIKEDARKWLNEIHTRMMTYRGHRDWSNPEFTNLYREVQEAIKCYDEEEDICEDLGLGDETFLILWMK